MNLKSIIKNALIALFLLESLIVFGFFIFTNEPIALLLFVFMIFVAFLFSLLFEFIFSLFKFKPGSKSLMLSKNVLASVMIFIIDLVFLAATIINIKDPSYLENGQIYGSGELVASIVLAYVAILLIIKFFIAVIPKCFNQFIKKAGDDNAFK